MASAGQRQVVLRHGVVGAEVARGRRPVGGRPRRGRRGPGRDGPRQHGARRRGGLALWPRASGVAPRRRRPRPSGRASSSDSARLPQTQASVSSRPVLPGEAMPSSQDRDGLPGAADDFQGGGQVDVGAARRRRSRPRRRRLLLDLVHLGEPGLDVAGVDHEAAEGEAGVEFDVLGADHAGVLHGALGGGEGLGPGRVQHRPVGDVGQHLGVHLGRRQARAPAPGRCPVPPSRRRGPAPGPAGSAGSRTRRRAAGRPRPPARCRARLVIFRARSRSPHSRPATAASAMQVEVAQGCGGRGRSRREGRPRRSRRGAARPVRRRGRRPTAPSPVPGAAVARSRRAGGGRSTEASRTAGRALAGSWAWYQ